MALVLMYPAGDRCDPPIKPAFGLGIVFDCEDCYRRWVLTHDATAAFWHLQPTGANETPFVPPCSWC